MAIFTGWPGRHTFFTFYFIYFFTLFTLFDLKSIITIITFLLGEGSIGDIWQLPGPRTNIPRQQSGCSYVGEVDPMRTFHFTGRGCSHGGEAQNPLSQRSPPYEQFTSGAIIPRHLWRTRENPERSRAPDFRSCVDPVRTL